MTAATSNTLESILLGYTDKGFSIIPCWGVDTTQKKPDGLHPCLCPLGAACQSAGKHPHGRLAVKGVHSNSREPVIIREWARLNPRGNWAIVTGLPHNGQYLICLDVDPRNGGDDSYANFISRYGVTPNTVRDISGGGGQHEFFLTSTQIGSRSIGPGLDLKSAGGYIVVSPSMHESGRPYVWDLGGDPSDTELAEAPHWIIEGSAAKRERPQWDGRSAKDSLMGAAFAAAGMLGDSMGEGKYAVVCPNAENHTDGRGFGKDASTVILPPIPGTDFGTFVCSHSHCSHLRWTQIMAALPPQAMATAKQKYPMRPQAVVVDAIEVPAPMGAADVVDVRERLHGKTTKSGDFKIIADLSNVNCILSYDPRWRGKIAFDSLKYQKVFLGDPPWHPDDKPAVQERYWEDDDEGRLILWIERNYDFTIDQSMARQAANIVAKREAFHPIREILNSFTWDGRPRLEEWLTTYMGVDSTPYTRTVGKWWLVSAVARVFKPGIKADYCLILEGNQRIGKSSALEILALNRDWFCDSKFDIGSKDSYQLIRGKWIVELGELDALMRADSATAKGFFSANHDSYRPSYGRETITVPRQCVFAGTVNFGHYLKDESGNSRYWPVLCTKIDLNNLSKDVAQLWAEAVHAFNSGDKWYPETADEHALCEVEQVRRGEEYDDIWLPLVGNWIDTSECKALIAEQGSIIVADVLERCCNVPKSQMTRAQQMRIGKILRLLGFEKTQRRAGNARVTAYKSGS